MSRPVLVLCEGAHDIAFLGRVLSASTGAQSLTSAVKDLPKPFGDLFTKRLGSRSADNAKFGLHGPVLPDTNPILEAAWKLADDTRHWYFLNCFGDSRHNEVRSFFELLVPLTQVEEPANRLQEMGIRSE